MSLNAWPTEWLHVCMRCDPRIMMLLNNMSVQKPDEGLMSLVEDVIPMKALYNIHAVD